MINKKRAQLQALPGYIITLVVVIIVLAIGALIVTEFQKNTGGENATAYNITAKGLTALDTVGSFQSILGIVIIAAVILTLVVGSMMIFK